MVALVIRLGSMKSFMKKFHKEDDLLMVNRLQIDLPGSTEKVG